MPDFPILRGLSVGEVAELGRHDGRGRSSMSWPSTTTAVSDAAGSRCTRSAMSRGRRLPSMPRSTRGGCASCSPSTAARSRWWPPARTRCAPSIGSTAGPPRWTGSTTRPTVSSPAHSRRSDRCAPDRSSANIALVGPRPSPARRDRARAGAAHPNPRFCRRARHPRGDTTNRRPHRGMTPATREYAVTPGSSPEHSTTCPAR